MSTFKHGGCFLSAAMVLVAAAMLGACHQPTGGSTPAPGANNPQKLNCPDSLLLFDPATRTTNRYTLLLFFKKGTNVDDTFSVKAAGGPGCIKDPDPKADSPGLIVVQGSCPSDCTHPAFKVDVALPWGPHDTGDPLQGMPIGFGTYNNPSPLPGSAGWGLLLRTPMGQANVMPTPTPRRCSSFGR